MEKLLRIRNELKEFYLERMDLIDGLLAAMLCRQHVLVIGPPGAAKSMLSDEVCRRLEGGVYFQWLLTKFTTPEEIFGAISLKALEEDRYFRVTAGKLPECHIAFLDEVFKANSSILNSLLTLINERFFHNDGKQQPVPLITLIGASNELPEGEELAALYDRFLVRLVVDYIEDDQNFIRLLKLKKTMSTAAISLEELKRLQEEVEAVELPESIYDMMLKLRIRLKKEGIIVSDRRYRQSLGLMQAYALLNGRREVIEDDFSVLAHTLWNDPEEIRMVREIIFQVANPFEIKAQIIFQQAQEIKDNALGIWPSEEEQTKAGIEAHAKLRKLTQRLEQILDDAYYEGRPFNGVEELKKQVVAFQEEVVEKCLGLKRV